MVCCMCASFLCQWSERESLHQTFPCFLLAAPTRAFSPTLVPPQSAHTWHASIVLKSSQGGKGGGGGGYWSRFTKKKSSASRFTANKKGHFTVHEKSEIFNRTIYTYRFYIQIVAAVSDRSGIAERVFKWVVSEWGVRGNAPPAKMWNLSPLNGCRNFSICHAFVRVWSSGMGMLVKKINCVN